MQAKCKVGPGRHLRSDPGVTFPRVRACQANLRDTIDSEGKIEHAKKTGNLDNPYPPNLGGGVFTPQI